MMFDSVRVIENRQVGRYVASKLFEAPNGGLVEPDTFSRAHALALKTTRAASSVYCFLSLP